MRVLVQRVGRASVSVDSATVGAVGTGLLALVGCRTDDSIDQVRWLADKLVHLRIFEDEEGRMNRSVRDIGGGILIVPQFTLYANVHKGRRPGFDDTMAPEAAEALIGRFVEIVRERAPGVSVATGQFGAHMMIDLVNDGPVTILLERDHA